MADSPTQWVWSDMKRRCMEPHRRGYENYGGRGIRVCDRWLYGEDGKSGFECFLADMGPRPTNGVWIEREDNDGDYTPANCSWKPRSAQDYNKRTTFVLSAFGRIFNLKQAAEHSGLPQRMIWSRITKLGWSHEDAMTRPPRIVTRRR